jgi:enoyl-CoA hydratase/carnithine racemase
VGHQRALEICLTRRRIPAQEAVRIGLALVSVSNDNLDVAVSDLVNAILEAPAGAGRAVTRLIGSAAVLPPEDQLLAEQSEQVKCLRELAAGAGT